jgi:hypothetical protein
MKGERRRKLILPYYDGRHFFLAQFKLNALSFPLSKRNSQGQTIIVRSMAGHGSRMTRAPPTPPPPPPHSLSLSVCLRAHDQPMRAISALFLCHCKG